MYIAVPLLLYIGERFLRVYRTRMEVDVVKVRFMNINSRVGKCLIALTGSGWCGTDE